LCHEFALAILDVQMPGMDGFQLAELMRGSERTKQIPIVFVSAAGRELNYAFKGYETGAVDFMQKPLDIHAVRSKVSVFVDLYRNSKRMARQVEGLERRRREQEGLLGEPRSTKRGPGGAGRRRGGRAGGGGAQARRPHGGGFPRTADAAQHADTRSAIAQAAAEPQQLCRLRA